MAVAAEVAGASRAAATRPSPRRARRAVAARSLSLAAFVGLWPAVLESLEADSPMLAAMLREAPPVELAGEGG